MTSTEMCILDCLKQFSFDKYLQKNNLSFFDSALNCSNKEIVFLHETKQKHLVVAFLFTPDLQVRFYFKKFSHIDQRTPLGKLKRIIVGKEVPYKVRIFHSVNVICTSSGS